MKKLIFLLPIFLFSCSKDSKEDEQVTKLKESLAGTTWTYYYKNPFGDVDITTYYFHPNENKVTYSSKHTRNTSTYQETSIYKYEYPKLYIANSAGKYDNIRPYTIDPYKEELLKYNDEPPLKKGTPENMQPYTIEDVIKVSHINTPQLFFDANTYWENTNRDKYFYFVMNTGENIVHWTKDAKHPQAIEYKRLEYPYIHLKTVYYKSVTDELGNKYEVVDENIPPLSEIATLKNNDKELEFRGETFYRLY